MLTLIIVLVLLGGWGGLGWYGYGTGPCANPNGPCPGPAYNGGGLVHMLLVIALVVILLRYLGVHGL